MVQPKKDIEWQPDIWTGESLDNLDLNLHRKLQREMFDQMFPLVTVKRLDRTKTQLDTLRGEPKVTFGPFGRQRPPDQARRFLPPALCRAYVDHNPRQQVLLRYGFDFPRDVVFTFLDFILKEDGIDIVEGDLVAFEGEEFELMTIRQSTESYWINTEFSFYTVAAAQRYRTEGDRKVDFGGT